ncbi:MAG: NADH:flavin oxidoreductase [Planctomycetota bacterium]|nr:NADH:flavin oxidoreductase [Planctomycetota bacterium]
MSLFEPCRIGSREARNRLIRSATSERLADESGRPGDELRALYSLLGRGGAGIIITGHAFVRPDGKSNAFMTGAHQDDSIPALSALAREAHRHDALIFLQVNHAGAFAARDLVDMLICVSEVPMASILRPRKSEPPPALHEPDTREVYDLVDSFCAAARRAEEAGYDGVQIHCAHGYLAGQFLSPRTNARTDEFGGNPENRLRFLRAIVERVVAAKGSDFIVGVKWNCADFVEGGLDSKESLEALATLVKAGVGFVEISGGVGDAVETILRKGVTSQEQEAYFMDTAIAFRERIVAPMALVGGIRSPQIAAQVVDRGFEFVSMSRPFIREPDIPLLFREGRRAACVSCNRCLFSKKRGVFCRCTEKGGPAKLSKEIVQGAS